MVYRLFLMQNAPSDLPALEMEPIIYDFPKHPNADKPKDPYRTIISMTHNSMVDDINHFNTVFKKPEFAFLRDNTYVFGSYIYDFLSKISLSAETHKYVIKMDITSAFDSVDFNKLEHYVEKHFDEQETSVFLKPYYEVSTLFPKESLRLYQGLPLSAHLFKLYLLETLNMTQSPAKIFIYVDDIIITGETKEIVYEVMKKMVCNLEKGGLYINQKKNAYFDLHVNDLIIMNRIISRNTIGKFDKNSLKLLHSYFNGKPRRGSFAFLTKSDIDEFKEENNVVTDIEFDTTDMFIPPEDYTGPGNKRRALAISRKITHDLLQLKQALEGLPSEFVTKFGITENLIPVLEKTTASLINSGEE